MKEFCPNKKSKEFKELVSIFGEDKSYLLWMRNNGYSLDKSPDGEESKLFSGYLEKTGDREKALRNTAAMLLSIKSPYAKPEINTVSINTSADTASSISDIRKVVSAVMQGYNFDIIEDGDVKYIKLNFNSWDAVKPVIYGRLTNALKSVGIHVAKNKDGVRKLKFSGNSVKIELKELQKKQESA